MVHLRGALGSRARTTHPPIPRSAPGGATHPFRAPRRAEPPTHSALRAGPRDRQGSEYRALPVTRLIKTGGGAGAVVGVAESMWSERSFVAARGTSTAPASPPVPLPLPSELNLGAGEARYSELCQHRGPARSAEWVGGWAAGCFRRVTPLTHSIHNAPPPPWRPNYPSSITSVVEPSPFLRPSIAHGIP